MIKKRRAKAILIAIPSMSESKKKELLKKLSKYPIEVKVLPSVSSIVSGEVSIESIKKVKVEDILGRLPVEPKKPLLKKNITGKNVLITGAGGSIGSELCRQILELSPKKSFCLNTLSLTYTISIKNYLPAENGRKLFLC